MAFFVFIQIFVFIVKFFPGMLHYITMLFCSANLAREKHMDPKIQVRFFADKI